MCSQKDSGRESRKEMDFQTYKDQKMEALRMDCPDSENRRECWEPKGLSCQPHNQDRLPPSHRVAGSTSRVHLAVSVPLAPRGFCRHLIQSLKQGCWAFQEPELPQHLCPHHHLSHLFPQARNLTLLNCSLSISKMDRIISVSPGCYLDFY